MFLVVGVLAALWERQTSGRGQVVDAAIVDGTGVLAQLQWSLRGAGAWFSGRGRNAFDGSAPFYDTYECADGRHVAVGCLEPQFFAAMLRGLGLDPEALPGQWERDRWAELRAALVTAFSGRTPREWESVFEGTDACVTPVLTYEEALDDAHLQSRGAFVRLNGVDQPAPAPRFSRTPAAPPSPATREGWG
jgi:alpha-methylacyl-CoA racemase